MDLHQKESRFTKLPSGLVPEAKFPDPANQPSPEDAAKLFAIKVEEIEHAYQCDYQTAFARAKLLNKDLVAAMAAGNKQLTNDNNVTGATFTPPDKKDLALGNDIPPAPVFGPQTKALLGLPGDADQQECEAAWKATRGATTPRDAQAIWKSLSALWSGRLAAQSTGNTKTATELFMKDRFPVLAQFVDFKNL